MILPRNRVPNPSELVFSCLFGRWSTLLFWSESSSECNWSLYNNNIIAFPSTHPELQIEKGDLAFLTLKVFARLKQLRELITQIIEANPAYNNNILKIVFSICYMFSCCGEQKIANFFDNVAPCKSHDHPVLFVCLEDRCRQLPLLCIECLPEHKNHKW